MNHGGYYTIWIVILCIQTYPIYAEWVEAGRPNEMLDMKLEPGYLKKLPDQKTKPNLMAPSTVFGSLNSLLQLPGVASLQTHGEVSVTHGEISGTHGEISATHGEVSGTHGEIAYTYEDMFATQDELDDNHGEISDTDEDIFDTHGEPTGTHEEVNDEDMFDTHHGEISDTQEEFEIIEDQCANISKTTEDSIPFQRGEHIGSGFYSDVYKGENIITGEIVAIKVQRLPEDMEARNRICQELEFLRQNLHANIPRYIASFMIQPGYYADEYEGSEDKEQEHGEHKEEKERFCEEQDHSYGNHSEEGQAYFYGNHNEEEEQSYGNNYEEGQEQQEEQDYELWIIIEYIQGVTLSSVLDYNGGSINNDQFAAAVIYDILATIASMHERGIIHGDPNSSNILLARDGSVKLADLGDCLYEQEDMYVDSGELLYHSPEIIRGDFGDRSVDIWALGILVIEILDGAPHNKDNDTKQSIEAHIADHGKPFMVAPEQVSPQAMDFIDVCLNMYPEHRPEAWELLSHEWLMAEDRRKVVAKEVKALIRSKHYNPYSPDHFL